MRALALLPLAAAALLAGCGGDGSGGGYGGDGASTTNAAASTGERMADREEPQPAASAAATGVKVKVVDSEFGRVIANGKGEAFYLFESDANRRSECYGACAEVWPPVITKGKPRAGDGAKANLLGTARRENGKLQLTYAGQPLYYYEHDSPGTILCHDVVEFGGLWVVVRPDGEAAA
jgi:predicted lipoprotein with Yx(FWY)xxD motif